MKLHKLPLSSRRSTGEYTVRGSFYVPPGTQVQTATDTTRWVPKV